LIENLNFHDVAFPYQVLELVQQAQVLAQVPGQELGPV
jgi:hypothetical protein